MNVWVYVAVLFVYEIRYNVSINIISGDAIILHTIKYLHLMTDPSFFTYSFKSIILVFLHIYGMIEYVYYINRLERLPVY